MHHTLHFPDGRLSTKQHFSWKGGMPWMTNSFYQINIFLSLKEGHFSWRWLLKALNQWKQQTKNHVEHLFG